MRATNIRTMQPRSSRIYVAAEGFGSEAAALQTVVVLSSKPPSHPVEEKNKLAKGPAWPDRGHGLTGDMDWQTAGGFFV